MADWKTIAERRFGNAIDEMRKIENTAAKRYDVDPSEAQKMLDMLEEAFLAVKVAYAPRIGDDSPRITDSTTESPKKATESPESPSIPSKNPDPSGKTPEYTLNRRGIPAFVAQIPDEEFPSWALHVANRMVGMAVEERA